MSPVNEITHAGPLPSTDLSLPPFLAQIRCGGAHFVFVGTLLQAAVLAPLLVQDHCFTALMHPPVCATASDSHMSPFPLAFVSLPVYSERGTLELPGLSCPGFDEDTSFASFAEPGHGHGDEPTTARSPSPRSPGRHAAASLGRSDGVHSSSDVGQSVF